MCVPGGSGVGEGTAMTEKGNEVGVVTVEIVKLLVVPTDTEELVTSGSAMEKLVLQRLAVQQQKESGPVERGAMHSVSPQPGTMPVCNESSITALIAENFGNVL